jgi:CheY-like chemotaxis protein
MEDSNRPHLLLVEDDRSLRTLIGMRIKAAGLDYTPCEDFLSAKQAIDSGKKFDGVWSDGFYAGDKLFPEVGSMSLLRHLHHQGLLATTPVVIASTMPHLIQPHLERLSAMPDMAGFLPPPVLGKEEPKLILTTLKDMMCQLREAMRPGANPGVPTGITRKP